MNTITTKLYKSGNSYSVRVPMGIVKYLGLQPGAEVVVGEFRPLASPRTTTAAMSQEIPTSQATSPDTAPKAHAPAASERDHLSLPLPLETLQSELRRHGVIKAHVFGSYARGDARRDSDLDLLVELAPGTTYLDLGGLQYALEQIAGCPIDIATRLNRHFAPYAATNMIEVL